jgi:hypothetical protein
MDCDGLCGLSKKERRRVVLRQTRPWFQVGSKLAFYGHQQNRAPMSKEDMDRMVENLRQDWHTLEVTDD